MARQIPRSRPGQPIREDGRIGMVHLWKSAGRPHPVSEQHLKLCPLCGALNDRHNVDCFTCGWAGVFSVDPQSLHLAWLRLADQFETVERKHVVRAQKLSLDEYGIVRTDGLLARLGDTLRHWRQRFTQRRRSATAAGTDRVVRRPGNELGV
jgi:hypothetical protein